MTNPPAATVPASMHGRVATAFSAAVALLAALLLGSASPAVAATEDIAPTRTIAGPNTGFSPPPGPFGIISNSAGELIVTDGPTHSILTFAADADGNVAPVGKIAGPNTGLFRPWALTQMDDGKIAVVHVTDVVDSGEIAVFAADADGDVAPVRTISGPATGLDEPIGLTVLPDGSLAALNGYQPQVKVGDTIHVYAADAVGNAAPARTIAGPKTLLDTASGLAALADGSLAVANSGDDSIAIFAAGATGDVAPVRVVKGPNTGLSNPVGVTLLSDGRLAVANSSANSLLVFPADADGDVAPLTQIAGLNPALRFPVFVAQLPNGDLAAVNFAASTVTVYGGVEPPVTVPEAPMDLRAVAEYQQVSLFFTPGADGGAPITAYEYSLDGGNSWASVEPAAASPIVIAGMTNGVSYEVLVRAVNEVGSGEPGGPVYVQPLGAAFVPVEPYRAYDSRLSGGPLTGGQSRQVVTGAPADAVAVAYNLTVVGMSGPGYLAVAPGDAPAGGTSTLNYTARGQQWANAYVSGVDEAGQIKVTAAGAATQFVVDVVGYYTPQAPPSVTAGAAGSATGAASVASVTPPAVVAADAGGGIESLFVPVVPTRAYDSRDIGAGGPLGNGAPRRVNVTAGGLVPAEATAVAYTLTQTGTVGRGVLTVAPAGQVRPAVSNINWFQNNQTSANSSVVGIDEGSVDVWAQSSTGGQAQFVIDILGYYLPADEAPWAAAFTPINPQRAYDSRTGTPRGPIRGGSTPFTTSMAVPGVPLESVAVAFNLTATGGKGTGYLTTTPGDVKSPPVASTINWWQPNQTLANGTVVDVPSLRRMTKAGALNGGPKLPVNTFAGGGSTQYVIDVAGYFTNNPDR